MEKLKIVAILEGNPEQDRRLIVETDDGRIFHAKNQKCPKRAGTVNSTWLANEVVYYQFARFAGLRVPDAAILSWDDEILFGSEKRSGRVELPSLHALLSLVSGNAENHVQLTKALLLDVALLNSDREKSAILVEQAGDLWFIDHDKSLWADGMEEHNFTSKPGDLWRTNVDHLPKETDNFIGNYLRFQIANTIVWNQDWSTLTNIFHSLPLSQEAFLSNCAIVPEEWLSQSLIPRMEQFLNAWWNELRQIFSHPDSQRRIKRILSLE